MFLFAVGMSGDLSGPYNNQHENCPYLSCCGDFSEVYIKLSHCSLYGFEKGSVFSKIPGQKDGSKIKNIRLESYSHIMGADEKNLVSSPIYRKKTKTQRQQS